MARDVFQWASARGGAQTAAQARRQGQRGVPWVCPVAEGGWVVLAGARLDARERCQAAARGFLSAWGRDFQLARADPSLQGGLVRPDEREQPLRAVPRTVVWRQEPRAGVLLWQVARQVQLDVPELALLGEPRVLPLPARPAQVLAP